MDLNVKSKTIKILEENKGENPYYHGLDNDFSAMTTKTHSIKTKLKNWDLLN